MVTSKFILMLLLKRVKLYRMRNQRKSGAKAERSRACVCSRLVVGVSGSNPAWGCFFLNKKKIIFQELDSELS